MKTNFVLRSEHQNCCGSSTGLRRSVLCCASENANAESFDSARYLSRYKASGKIHKAASQGDVGKVQRKLLGGKNDVNARDKKNRTALHYACAYGHPNIVVLLIEKKCEVNIRDSDNSTALIKASQCQHEECVTLLLKYGADPNVRDASGNTAIHYTIYTDNVPIAAKLLAYNASIELQTKDGFTPLLLALKENKEQMAEFLIENKANIHAVDELNRSTLMYAVQCESKHMVKFLLQQGVDVFLKDAFGWSASSYALYGHCEVIKRTLSKYEEKILRCIPHNNPDSPASESCGPGFRKSPQEGKSSCYFPYTPCPENEISSGTDAGDSPNLVDLLYSCDRLIQCKISRCALLSRKVKIMENKIRRPQEELLEIEEVKSQLEDENSELDEICHIRILLQQEDLKKDNADQYFGNIETVLREKGNHNDAEEIGQLAMYAKMLYIEISRINYHFKQLQEEEAQDKEAVQSSEMMHNHLQKFKHEYCMLEDIIKKIAMKLEELQKKLMGMNLTEDELVKKLIESVQKLEIALIQKKKKMEELEKEFKEHPKMAKEKVKENQNKNGECNIDEHLKESKLEKDLSVNMLIHEISDVKQKLETTSSKYTHLKEHIQCLEQDMLSIKGIPKKWEHLEKNHEDLEEKFLIFKNLIQEHMEKIEDQDNLKHLRDSNNESILSQIELRLKSMKTEIYKMEAENESRKIKEDRCKKLQMEDVKCIKSLLSELNDTAEELEPVNRKCLLKKEQKQSLHRIDSTRSVLEGPCISNCDSSDLNFGFIPRENLNFSSMRLDCEDLRKHLYKSQRKLAKLTEQ
ncbi:POTE ankyrin domain family member A-like [Dipodomys merriami]|uniref:POTE ankyrin domain family member A-like n=1 Tax=Dipodomys merriami TaxID=94247 RepID=UPI003855C7B3